MTRYYKATIEMLICADNVAETNDAISDLLSESLARYVPGSAIMDWEYALDEQTEMPKIVEWDGIGFDEWQEMP